MVYDILNDMSSLRQYPQFFGPSTSESKDKQVQFSSDLIDFFSSKFNRIRHEDDKERGNCIDCARETVNVLINDSKSYEPITISDSNATNDDSFLLSKPKKKFKTTKEGSVEQFLEYLKNADHSPGSIFFVDNEDHDYVIFKSYENDLYLIDSDAHYYSLITNSESLKCPAKRVFPKKSKDESEEDEMVATREQGFYHYFYDVEEDVITVHHMGTAHPSWKNVVELSTALAESKKTSPPDAPPRSPFGKQSQV